MISFIKNVQNRQRPKVHKLFPRADGKWEVTNNRFKLSFFGDKIP